MATFNIKIDPGDRHLLRLDFGDEPADGDRIVREIHQKLTVLMDSGALSGGPLLRVDGRCSLAGSYLIATRLRNRYESMAARDLKMGANAYIVGYSRTSKYRVGDLLTYPSDTNAPSLKIALCGPPNTGKTCLREGLKDALGKLDPKPPSYIISACPDGDGSWFNAAARLEPVLAKQLKDAYKKGFTPEFTQWKAKEISNIRHSLLVFDVGGRFPSDENRVIMAEATHAIILWKPDGASSLEDWRSLCAELNLPVIAEVESQFDAPEDCISNSEAGDVLTGAVHRLARGEALGDRPFIKALAQHLAALWQAG